jgi:phospholipase/carboxylesterase
VTHPTRADPHPHRQLSQCRTEFAHLHPPHDGSLHLTLPDSVYAQVLERGWGDPHPISGTMMLFGPRDSEELEVAWSVVLASYRFATGEAP